MYEEEILKELKEMNERMKDIEDDFGEMLRRILRVLERIEG